MFVIVRTARGSVSEILDTRPIFYIAPLPCLVPRRYLATHLHWPCVCACVFVCVCVSVSVVVCLCVHERTFVCSQFITFTHTCRLVAPVTSPFETSSTMASVSTMLVCSVRTEIWWRGSSRRSWSRCWYALPLSHGGLTFLPMLWLSRSAKILSLSLSLSLSFSLSLSLFFTASMTKFQHSCTVIFGHVTSKELSLCTCSVYNSQFLYPCPNREHRSIMLRRVPLSIWEFWMCCKFLVELVGHSMTPTGSGPSSLPTTNSPTIYLCWHGNRQLRANWRAVSQTVSMLR